ncbi:MAG: helix-turn-helix domain-containing protein [Rikenellaceae bacterium]|nr:helix-turn-helix domain-containing protein [Rikenellaceae bacterium]
MEGEIKEYGFKSGLPQEVEVKPLSDVFKTPRLFRGPSKAEFYQIIWVSEGSAVFDIDFRKIRAVAGELFIISVNQVYGFDLGGMYDGKIILFTDTFFSQSEIDGSFLHISEVLNPSDLNRTFRLDNGKLTGIVGIIEDELRTPADQFQPYIVQGLLRALLLEIERVGSSAASPMFRSREGTVGRRFCDGVEKHYKQHRQSVFYQNLLSVTEKTLAKEVKALTGKTPKNYIDNRIILEAKRLLSYSGNSVKEISAGLGFNEPTNFNKFFRKHTGITPLRFRQTYMKNE